MQNGTAAKQDFALSWKETLSTGITIPTRKKGENCVKYFDKICDICRARTKRA